MNIAVIGTDHTVADITARERIATIFRDCAEMYEQECPIVLLQTCNRNELYFSAENLRYAHKNIKKILYAQVPDLINTVFYSFTSLDCFTHLIEVTTGLKSALFAETAIQGQMRRSYEEARKKPLSKELHFLFQKSLKIAKNIRASAHSCEQTKYLEQLTYEKVAEFLSQDTTAPLLFIGASTINSGIARYLRGKGYTNTVVCNRTPVVVPQYARSVAWSGLEKACKEAAVIIAATTCPQILLTEKMLQATSKKLLIDLSMPRNIAPELAKEHPLINIDTLSRMKRGMVQPYAYDHTRQYIREAVTKQASLFVEKKAIAQTRTAI